MRPRRAGSDAGRGAALTNEADLTLTYGTPEPVPEMVMLSVGALSVSIFNGDLRQMRFRGVEVLRRLSYPIRDERWGTLGTVTLSEALDRGQDGIAYARAFRSLDGRLEGTFDLSVGAKQDRCDLTATLRIVAGADISLNRCGFTLLHPLSGVTGTPLTLRHPDGSRTDTHFPALIHADQPARNIAALSHVVQGVHVDVRMEGEVFEMEDQRNWSDASFKTYCRPLSLPRPYPLRAGEELRQTVRIALRGTPAAPNAAKARVDVTLPQVALAHEAGTGRRAQMPPGLSGMPLLLRVAADAAVVDLPAGLRSSGDLSLEVLLPAGADPATSFDRLARTCAEAGVSPKRVAALPTAYLASHQPDGVWPSGPRPDDLTAPLIRAFPVAEAGAGAFTNFTELNRCRPDMGAVAFLTFGSSAIVHAADDASVLETLEAWPDILASAREIAAGKPLRLGLVSIGMRSNPYGAGVAANPGNLRTAMAMDDPRQRGLFAAAWAVGLLARMAEGDVQSVALAMTDGPLGVIGAPGGQAEFRPLYHVLRWAADRGGLAARVERAGTVVALHSAAGMIAANLAPVGADAGPVRTREAAILSARTFAAASGEADWVSRAARQSGVGTLPPFAIAFAGGKP
jgi:D-apionolactonase